VTRSDVADSLARWREALREAERAPPGTYERTIAESYAERIRQEYLRAVVRMTGQGDQLEEAIEAASLPASSPEVVEASRHLSTADPPTPRELPVEESEVPAQ
jgi:hypothetical protein